MLLREKASKVNSNGGVSFMEGRDKSELIMDEILTVDDFGFIKGEDGEYVVLSTQDYPKFFFFGGSVITQKFKELEENKEEVQKEGLPVRFEQKVSKKSKREYVTCEFYPDLDTLTI